MKLRGSWINPAVPYRLVSGCVMKDTHGNNDFFPTWGSRNGESKFATMIATPRIQSRFIGFLRNDDPVGRVNSSTASQKTTSTADPLLRPWTGPILVAAGRTPECRLLWCSVFPLLLLGILSSTTGGPCSPFRKRAEVPKRRARIRSTWGVMGLVRVVHCSEPAVRRNCNPEEMIL